MRSNDEIAAIWAERTQAMQAQPYSHAVQSPRIYAEPVHSAFDAAAASRDALPALILHLKGVTALLEALDERKPELEPDAERPRRIHSQR